MPSPVPAPSDDERDPRTKQHATYQSRVFEHARYFHGKALLTPKNKDAEDMNKQVLRRMVGEEHVLYSADSIASGDDSEALGDVGVTW